MVHTRPDGFLETGDVGGYRYLTTDRIGLYDVLSASRDLLVGRVVWISSFDGGPPKPTDEELAAGWREYKGLAASPVVGAATDLPYENYDEWWVDVEEPDSLVGLSFVDNGGFRLAGAAAAHDRVGDPDRDDYREAIADLQRRFWTALWASRADMYIGDGNLFNFACRDRRTFGRVLTLAGGSL